MQDAFRISEPEKSSIGDFLSFTVFDDERKRPARITGTALALFGGGDDRIAVFERNAEKICRAAYLMSRKNPALDILILGSGSFPHDDMSSV
ncbi:hypothetical protein [Paraburkholderia sp. 32]|uniref:hypothetical protein n=1 Tax=Paraburkholderia sp. 32 TaxID=2991057 RepID=UPI003D22A910